MPDGKGPQSTEVQASRRQHLAGEERSATNDPDQETPTGNEPVHAAPTDPEIREGSQKARAEGEIPVPDEHATPLAPPLMYEEQYVVMHNLARYQRGDNFVPGEVVTLSQIKPGAFDNQLKDEDIQRLINVGAIKPLSDPEAALQASYRARAMEALRRQM